MTRDSREAIIAIIERCAAAIGIGIVECERARRGGYDSSEPAGHGTSGARTGLGTSDVLLLDAFVTDLEMPQVGLIDGDALCLSIAAASIVAKVTRDRLMIELHQIDCRYGLDQHVGYGTKLHLRALSEHGPRLIFIADRSVRYTNA